MGGRKKFGSLFFLLVGITVFFGLLSAGCAKESTQTGQPGSQSSTGGQGYPNTSTGPQGYQGSTFAKIIKGVFPSDWLFSFVQSSDGGYFVAGESEDRKGIYVVKLDGLGNVQWAKTIALGSSADVGSATQSSDGGFVVVGRIWGPEIPNVDNYDMFVVKLDSSGNVQWAKTIGGNDWDAAGSIMQTSDGGFIVGGRASSFAVDDGSMFILKLDSSGNVKWAKTIGGGAYATSIIQSSDGGYAVAGFGYGAGRIDFYVVKLDSSGNVQWARTIGGYHEDGPFSIIQTTDGGYVVAGYTESFGAGDEDIYVVKLDSSGNVEWTKTIGGSGDDVAGSIIQSSDGGYIVAGFTENFGAGDGDIFVVKLDSSGNIVWAKTIGGSKGDGALKIVKSSDGGYVLAGWTESFGGGGIYIVKTDSNLNVCFSQNVTSYLISVSSNVGSSSSPSATVFPQSPTVNTLSPTVASYASSVSDVCALAPAPHLSASQDCSFSSAIVTNGEKENAKSYGYSAGVVLSRFLIPASMLIIIYGRFRFRKEKKKDGQGIL